MQDHNTLDLTFAALAHSTRRAILSQLSAGPATVKELAEPFDMSLPAISKHIKVLERAGLIIQGKQAQFRPCTLNPEPLKNIANWTEYYRPIWEARFDKMDQILNTLQEPKHER